MITISAIIKICIAMNTILEKELLYCIFMQTQKNTGIYRLKKTIKLINTYIFFIIELAFVVRVNISFII